MMHIYVSIHSFIRLLASVAIFAGCFLSFSYTIGYIIRILQQALFYQLSIDVYHIFQTIGVFFERHIYIYIYIYIYTHTHTYIYIYYNTCMCARVYAWCGNKRSIMCWLW